MGMEQDVADEGEDQARPPGQQGSEVEEVFGEAGAFASGQALESGLSLEGWERITVAGSGRRQRRVDQRVGDAALTGAGVDEVGFKAVAEGDVALGEADFLADPGVQIPAG